MKEPIYFRVYTLVDPRSLEVKYVGVTIDPKVRLAAHIADAPNISPQKRAWVSELKELGLLPSMEIVEICEAAEEAAAKEKQVYDFHNKGQLVMSDPGIHRYKYKDTGRSSKKKTSFCLSDNAIQKLLELCEINDRSQASMLEVLIGKAHEQAKG